jgi:hypothetical protein
MPVINKRAVQKKIKYLFLREKAIILLRNLFISGRFYIFRFKGLDSAGVNIAFGLRVNCSGHCK